MKVQLIANGQPAGLIDVTDDSIVGALLGGRQTVAQQGLADMMAGINRIGGAEIRIEIKERSSSAFTQ